MDRWPQEGKEEVSVWKLRKGRRASVSDAFSQRGVFINAGNFCCSVIPLHCFGNHENPPPPSFLSGHRALIWKIDNWFNHLSQVRLPELSGKWDFHKWLHFLNNPPSWRGALGLMRKRLALPWALRLSFLKGGTQASRQEMNISVVRMIPVDSSPARIYTENGTGCERVMICWRMGE